MSKPSPNPLRKRLLYVALTRAMRGLKLLVPKDCRHRALVELDTTQWHLEVAG